MKTTDDINVKTTLAIIAALAALTFFVRFPFYFPAVINWDESSAILMGQSIVNGHLPYTEQWNVKPPLLYYIFASFITIFGPSIEAVRFGGTLFVTLIAAFTFFAARKIWDVRISFAAAAITIILISAVRGGQAVMSVILALAPLMLAMLMLLKGPLTLSRVAMVGALLGVAGMIRLNLAFVAAAVGLLILFHAPLRNGLNRFLLLGVFAVSGFAVIGATIIPHILNGTEQAWLSAVFLAPMSYASSQHSFVGSLLRQSYSLTTTGHGLGLAVFLATFVYFKTAGLGTPENPAAFKTQRLILACFFFSTLVSILASGGAFQHYLIHICPFMSIFAAAVLVPGFDRLKTVKAKRICGVVAVVVLVASVIPVFQMYVKVINRAQNHASMRGSPEYQIADYLRERVSAEDGVYMMTDHIVYWFLNRPPIDQTVSHPSNIAKEYLLKHMPGKQPTTELALSELLAMEPRYIVKTEKMNYLDNHPDAVDVLFETLESSYALETQIAGRQIYRRIN